MQRLWASRKKGHISVEQQSQRGRDWRKTAYFGYQDIRVGRVEKGNKTGFWGLDEIFIHTFNKYLPD